MIDPTSPTWHAVKALLEKQIASSGTRLEIAGLSQTETEFERGRIMAYRDVLALGKPPVQIPATDPQY